MIPNTSIKHSNWYGTEKDKQVIKEVIQTAYVGGLQNLISSEQQVRDGFDLGFNLLGV